MSHLRDAIAIVTSGGLSDEELQELNRVVVEQIRHGRRMRDSMAVTELQVKQRVRIRRDAGLRPKFLCGAECVVEQIVGAKVRVSGLPGRFAYGQTLLPAGVLEALP